MYNGPLACGFNVAIIGLTADVRSYVGREIVGGNVGGGMSGETY